MSSPQVDYLIVGAGVNGTSIATTLASLGFSVSILDRSADGFVAPDGASHDLNKIVRADYTDANYCTLAKEAISRWRSSPILSRYYHEVGVLFRSSETGTIFGPKGSASADEYVQHGIDHARLPRDQHLEVAASGHVLKQTAYRLENDAQVGRIFGGVKHVPLGDGLKGMGSTQTGYFNPRGGWAEANNACRALLSHAIRLGVKVHPGAVVTRFSYDSQNMVDGLGTEDGRVFKAKHIILAAGAWTSDLLTLLSPTTTTEEENGPKWMTRPSAQCVAILRLTPSEAKCLANIPVIINFSSGFYQFEPVFNPSLNEHHMKIAYHSNGYLHPKPPLHPTGTYPTFNNPSDETVAQPHIPPNRLDEMLHELSRIFPTLAHKSRIVTTRVCWYSDTLDENWIIDTVNNHPRSSIPGGDRVWVVSGDSGHAYKFLPIIGDVFATVSGLMPNVRNLDLTRFTFSHQARLHQHKLGGKQVVSADSNRFNAASVAESQNLRARL